MSAISYECLECVLKVGAGGRITPQEIEDWAQAHHKVTGHKVRITLASFEVEGKIVRVNRVLGVDGPGVSTQVIPVDMAHEGESVPRT